MGDEGEMKFGEKVRALRRRNQVSLRKFAAQVGMSPTYLSKIERGDFRPPAEEKVTAMARLLGQNEDEFLALANRVASDLTAIIQERPKVWADFLRTLRMLPQEEMKRLLDQTREKASRQRGGPGRRRRGANGTKSHTQKKGPGRRRSRRPARSGRRDAQDEPGGGPGRRRRA